MANNDYWGYLRDANELKHGRTFGSKNGMTKYPGKYRPVGDLAQGVRQEDGSYVYDRTSHRSTPTQISRQESARLTQMGAAERADARAASLVDTNAVRRANQQASVLARKADARFRNAIGAGKTKYERAALNAKTERHDAEMTGNTGSADLRRAQKIMAGRDAALKKKAISRSVESKEKRKAEYMADQYRMMDEADLNNRESKEANRLRGAKNAQVLSDYDNMSSFGQKKYEELMSKLDDRYIDYKHKTVSKGSDEAYKRDVEDIAKIAQKNKRYKK